MRRAPAAAQALAPSFNTGNTCGTAERAKTPAQYRHHHHTFISSFDTRKSSPAWPRIMPPSICASHQSRLFAFRPHLQPGAAHALHLISPDSPYSFRLRRGDGVAGRPDASRQAQERHARKQTAPPGRPLTPASRVFAWLSFRLVIDVSADTAAAHYLVITTRLLTLLPSPTVQLHRPSAAAAFEKRIAHQTSRSFFQLRFSRPSAMRWSADTFTRSTTSII